MLVCDCHFLFVLSVFNLILSFLFASFLSFIRSFLHSFIRSLYVHPFTQSIYCFRIMEAVATELTVGLWDRISGGASVDRSMSVMDSLALVILQR